MLAVNLKFASSMIQKLDENVSVDDTRVFQWLRCTMMSLKPFMTSFNNDDEVVVMMKSTFEEGEIVILLLPKQYERSEKKKNESLCPIRSSRCCAARHTWLHWKGKALFTSLTRYLRGRPRPGLRPSRHRSRTVTVHRPNSKSWSGLRNKCESRGWG